MTERYSSLSILAKNMQDVYFKSSCKQTTLENKLKHAIRPNDTCTQTGTTKFCWLECWSVTSVSDRELFTFIDVFQFIWAFLATTNVLKVNKKLQSPPPYISRTTYFASSQILSATEIIPSHLGYSHQSTYYYTTQLHNFIQRCLVSFQEIWNIRLFSRMDLN